MTRDQAIRAVQSRIVNDRALSGVHPVGQGVVTVQDLAVALEEWGLLTFDAGVPEPPPPTAADEFADIIHRYFSVGANEAYADAKSITAELEKRGVKIVRADDQG